MTRLLWVTHESPDPTRGGGGLRQAGLLLELATRFEIDLLVAGEAPPEPVAAAMHRVVRVDGAPPARRRSRLRHAIGALSRTYVPEVDGIRSIRAAMLDALADPSLREASVSLVNHLPLAPLLPALPGAAVFHPHHVTAERLAGEAARAAGARAVRLRRYAANAARMERWAVRAAAMTVVVSLEDAALLEVDPTTTAVAPNAVDVDVSDGFAARASDPIVLFPASLDYPPNVDGALWMAEQIWPAVRRAVPAARLLLVGRSPGPAVRALAARPGIEVHADVPHMADWLRAARVVVVPLRFGSGTRLKALEAMAAGRPVVGTTVGLAGLGIDDGIHAHVADDPVALAERIVLALGPEGDALVTPARLLVEAHFTWPVVAAGLADSLEQVQRGAR